LLPKPDTCWRRAGVMGAAVAVTWAVDVVMAGRVGMFVMVVGPLPLPGHPEPGVHWAYQAF